MTLRLKGSPIKKNPFTQLNDTMGVAREQALINPETVIGHPELAHGQGYEVMTLLLVLNTGNTELLNEKKVRLSMIKLNNTVKTFQDTHEVVE